jgi:DNA-binding FadR family transcriptional regulator
VTIKKPTNIIKAQINNSVELDQNKFNAMYERFFEKQVTSSSLNESFGAFYTAKDLGMVAEGGFSMHPSVQGMLDEDAADHLRQASILQRTGKFQTASMHRKIAAALQRGDATAAKALTSELKNINE